MSKLKPCPFCGEKEQLHLKAFSGLGNPVIVCYGCLAVFSRAESACKEDLIAAWNRRVFEPLVILGGKGGA